jgi:hypothetical protein
MSQAASAPVALSRQPSPAAYQHVPVQSPRYPAIATWAMLLRVLALIGAALGGITILIGLLSLFGAGSVALGMPTIGGGLFFLLASALAALCAECASALRDIAINSFR